MKPMWTSDEIESDRQERLEELKDETVSDAPGSFACHELLDRTALLMENVDRFILEHPSCIRNKEWFSLAHQAFDSLFKLYQDIGDKHLGAESVAPAIMEQLTTED